jgi:putative Holliday junction resolvase
MTGAPDPSAAPAPSASPVPAVPVTEPLSDSACSAESPARSERSLLAFDFGTRRVGVAVGGRAPERATPLCTIDATGDARFAAIEALIREWQPDALVVGVPFHPDGAPHDNTARARRFARQLHGRYGLPVHEVDERWTTTEARAAGATDLDAAAAALILQQHLSRT